MTDKNGINRDMVAYYRDRAQQYDDESYGAGERPERQTDMQEATKIVQETLAGKHVLEIAAGTGFWTEGIAKTAQTITATDINEATLNVARKRHFPEGKVTFQTADLYSLGSLPAHDALFGGFIFSHISKQERQKFFDTVNSYVTPGGTVILMDNTIRASISPITRTDEHGNTYKVRSLRDGSKHEIVKIYDTEDDLRKLLGNRATNIDFKELEHYWILTYQTPKARE